MLPTEPVTLDELRRDCWIGPVEEAEFDGEGCLREPQEVPAKEGPVAANPRRIVRLRFFLR